MQDNYCSTEKNTNVPDYMKNERDILLQITCHGVIRNMQCKVLKFHL